MLSQPTISTGLPPTIHKAVLSFPGATPASKQLVEHLLEQDREAHHCFYGPGFHNHLSHHLLAAYDLGAPPALLQDIFDAELDGLLNVHTVDRASKAVEPQDLAIDVENWTRYLGQDKYYANFAVFFAGEVTRLGAHAAYEHYVFSDAANKDGAYMLERFVGGAVHPLIQMGYALEFNSDAMVAQALAQTAVHDAFQPDIFPWNVPSGAPDPDGPRVPALAVLHEMYASAALTPVLPYEPDALLSKRRKDAFTPARTAELRRLAARWDAAHAGAPAELAFLAVLLFAGTGLRAGRAPRLDFFLMHILTSVLFVPVLAAPLRSPAARVRLLTAYLAVALAYVLLRGRPRVDAAQLMARTATPRPPSERGGDDSTHTNPWPALLTHVLPARDAHTLKALRTLYVCARRYSAVRAGVVAGAVDAAGRETHPGAAVLDGSVFVRAAGVLVDVMGWAGPGEEQAGGAWDRSALGWDAAWDGGD